MDTFRDIVEFESEAFAPVLGEDSQVNPGVYGAELAFWLCRELASRGVMTSYPQSEDWGWFIEYFADSGAEFAVHCGNAGGSKSRWLLSLHRRARKMFGRDKPSYEEASDLVAAVRQATSAVARPGSLSWRWDAAT